MSVDLSASLVITRKTGSGQTFGYYATILSVKKKCLQWECMYSGAVCDLLLHKCKNRFTFGLGMCDVSKELQVTETK